MLTSRISFKNFKKKKSSINIKKKLKSITNEKNQIIFSLGKNYNYSFEKKKN